MSPQSEYLIALRELHAYPQAKFGSLMGLAGSHVSIIELGQRYAPTIDTLRVLVSALGLSESEQYMLKENALFSPRKLRIPPDAPAEAFRFIATLDMSWPDISPTEFESMQSELYRLHHALIDRRREQQCCEVDEEKIMT